MIKVKRYDGKVFVQFGLLFAILGLFGFKHGAFTLRYLGFVQSRYWDYEPLLSHEVYHLNRQAEMGLSWFFHYFSDDLFRYQEEQLAVVAELSHPDCTFFGQTKALEHLHEEYGSVLMLSYGDVVTEVFRLRYNGKGRNTK